jgi:hypothetical protein
VLASLGTLNTVKVIFFSASGWLVHHSASAQDRSNGLSDLGDETVVDDGKKCISKLNDGGHL